MCFISIREYKEYNTDTTVKFIVKMTPENLAKSEEAGLHKVFKLQNTITTNSMVTTVFCIVKYTVKPRLSGMHLSGNTAIRTVFLGDEKMQRYFAPFNRKSVFPEPDSSLGNQTMFCKDQRSVLSGHALRRISVLDWRLQSFCISISARDRVSSTFTAN